jgi:hypothetical protein
VKTEFDNFFYYLFKRMKKSTIVGHIWGDHAFCVVSHSIPWCCGHWYDIITWETTFSSTWIKSYPMLFVTCLTWRFGTWLCCYRIRSHEFFQINNENSTHVWHDIINISPNTIYQRAEPYLFSFLYLETKMRLCLQGEPQ